MATKNKKSPILRASMRFGVTLVFWAVLGTLILFFTLYVSARSNIDFLEAMGMLRNADLRSAVLSDLFRPDGVLTLTLLSCFLGVFLLATLFALSQYLYFERLIVALEGISEGKSKIKRPRNLGPFRLGVQWMFKSFKEQMSRKKDARFQGLTSSTPPGVWNETPRTSILDLTQFAALSICLAGFVGLTAWMVFMRLHIRMVELYPRLTNLKFQGGEHFLEAQDGLWFLIACVISIFVGISFLVVGIRFGKQFGGSVFAVSRDLRCFTEGDLEHRVFLRGGDSAGMFVERINQGLDRLEKKVREG